MPNDPFLSTEEIGRQIGMSTEWVRRQVLAGRLRARVFAVGSRSTYRIRRSDLELFLKNYTTLIPGDGRPLDPSADPRFRED